jgi:TRAP-type uncharacterized transport system substrate-binding protein
MEVGVPLHPGAERYYRERAYPVAHQPESALL